MTTSSFATTPADTEITNTASVVFDIGNGTLSSNSNQSLVTTQRTPASIALFQYAPASSTVSEEAPSSCRNGNGGPFEASIAPLIALPGSGAVTLDPNEQIELAQAQIYHAGDPIFIQVDDPDQNLNPSIADALTVNISSTLGDQEDIRLTETDVNSGIFIGYIQSSANALTEYNCELSVDAGSSITVSYTDEFDNADTVASSTLVDPFGIAFDSTNGEPVDGITITLIDALTGQPATPGVHIFGDDGVSAYPNTLVTGSSATDSNGTVVIFPEGGYRFPLLLPGQYQLRVSISPGFAAPSLIEISDLQALPNAPFALLDDASYGETFTLNPGPPLHVDIPVDPVTVELVVEKVASKSEAGIGDFVQYQVTVENVDTISSAREVLITDVLPQGFRYRAGSARLDNEQLADPVIAADGRTLLFTTRDMPPTSRLGISYVTEVTAGTPLGDAINTASATDRLGASSNIARVRIDVQDEFMREHVTVVGRVIVGNCPLRESGNGYANVRLRSNLSDDIVDYVAEISVDGIKVFNYQLIVILPAGITYLSGSSRLDDLRISDPELRGNKLVYRLGNGDAWPSDWAHSLRFRAQVQLKDQSIVHYKTQAYSSMDSLYQTGQSTAKAETVVATNPAETIDLNNDSGLITKEIIGQQASREQAGVGTELKGLEGVRIYLENGTYVVTDTEGKYHFEGILPGTHVVQVDKASLPSDMELIQCEKNTRFAGKAHSKFVDVKGGTLWRADFHVQAKPPVLSNVSLAMNSEVVNKEIILELNMKNGSVPINNYRLTVLLPDQLSYELGSSEIDGMPVSDPDINQTALMYHIDSFPNDAKKSLRLKAKLLNMSEGELSIKSYAMFDTEDKKRLRVPMVENTINKTEDRYAEKLFVFQPKFGSFEVELSDDDKRELDQFIQSLDIVSIENLLVVGHSDDIPIKKENKHIFKDNYELSEARAKAVADYIRVALGLDEKSVVSEGKGPDQAVASNDTAEGRAKNRRTELYINTVQMTSEGEVSTVKNNSGEKSVTISGRKAEERKYTVISPPTIKRHTIESFGAQWLESAEPGVEWLFPVEGFTPKIPALNIGVKHFPNNNIEARINGEIMNPLFFYGVDTNAKRTVARSYWKGIHLKDGPNEISFAIKDAQNNLIQELKRTVYYSAAPVKAELVKEYSNLIADGITVPVLAVKFYDQWNQPVRPDVVGKFTISEPYFSKELFDATKKSPVDALNRKEPQYTTGDHGIALIELQPTSQTGQVRLSFNFGQEITQEITAWLQPSQRDWIVVGLADATVGSNTFSGNESSALGAGLEEDYEEGKLAVFAKGTIAEKWLLTASIDTSKEKETGADRLFQTIDPDEHFTLYGDDTEQYYEAPSTEKVFAKIEREQFYAMFGDYATNLNDTEFSRYARSVTGIKSEYHGEIFSINTFATETSLRYIKDEIQGDGTSGLYRLSQGNNIILNSETVTIETRDRFHSQDVLQSRTMRRHFDYDIDYHSGTIFFREPITSRDANFNPNIIVIEYEVETDLVGGTSGGGRAAFNLFAQKLEIGISAIRDDAFQTQGDLYGTDITYKVSQNSQINVEFASTDVTDAGAERTGDAYLAEYRHSSGSVDGKVYVREQQAAFGLGQQAGSETGMRKYGIGGGYRLNDHFRINTEIFHEENLLTANQRDVTELGLGYSDKVNTAMIGFRSALDEDVQGETRESELLLLGASRSFANKKFLLRLNNEISLNSEGENPDYPSRYIVGMDYLWRTNVSFYAEHEITEGELLETSTTRAGVRSSPWANSQINTAVEEQSSEFGPRVFSTLGLTQRFEINDRWSSDMSFDRVDTMRAPELTPFNTNVLPSSGTLNNDFTAVSLGLNYISEQSTLVNRIESRESDNEDKKGVYTGWYRDQSEGIGYSLKGQWYDSVFASGDSAMTADMRFSFSYRPVDSQWIHLNRLDYVLNSHSDLDGGEMRGRKFINNWKGNYLINRSNQIAFSYGLKYVLDSFDNDEYSGITQYMGTEYRRDITPKWDIGLRGSVLHSQKAKNYTYSYGVDAGWSMVDNMWLSVGYNFDGFEDPDFSLAGYTAKGFFIKLRMKFDQHLFHDIKNARRQ